MNGYSPIAERIMSKAGCNHEPEPGEPAGYVAWFTWAEKYAKTHNQFKCPKCGLYAIWKPRPG